MNNNLNNASYVTLEAIFDAIFETQCDSDMDAALPYISNATCAAVYDSELLEDVPQ
jgi:hypothetical protein